MAEETKKETPRKGRRTDAEIKAEALSEVTPLLEKMQAKLDALEAESKKKNAQMANLSEQVKTNGRVLKKTQQKITNEQVLGIARATGGASHEDLPDGTPWTPAPPDWVTDSYTGPDGSPTDDSELAVYLWKQAYLDDRKIYNIDQLQDVMAAYKAGTHNVGTYTEPEGPKPEALAAEAMGNV